MEKLKVLEDYHKHLYANSRMYNIYINEWDSYKDSPIEVIESRFKSIYNEINVMNSRTGKIISILIKQDYKMSSLKTLDQWYRDKQLYNLLDEDK